MVCWVGRGFGMGGRFRALRNMSLLLGLEPFQKFGLGGGGWWSIEIRFGPNRGLIFEAWTKLNNLGEDSSCCCFS